MRVGGRAEGRRPGPGQGIAGLAAQGSEAARQGSERKGGYVRCLASSHLPCLPTSSPSLCSFCPCQRLPSTTHPPHEPRPTQQGAGGLPAGSGHRWRPAHAGDAAAAGAARKEPGAAAAAATAPAAAQRAWRQAACRGHPGPRLASPHARPQHPPQAALGSSLLVGLQEMEAAFWEAGEGLGAEMRAMVDAAQAHEARGGGLRALVERHDGAPWLVFFALCALRQLRLLQRDPSLSLIRFIQGAQRLRLGAAAATRTAAGAALPPRTPHVAPPTSPAAVGLSAFAVGTLFLQIPVTVRRSRLARAGLRAVPRGGDSEARAALKSLPSTNRRPATTCLRACRLHLCPCWPSSQHPSPASCSNPSCECEQRDVWAAAAA